MKNLTISLAKLINNLVSSGFIKAAIDVDELLRELLENEKEQEDDDADVAANLIGLQEDETTSNMNQGYALSPFFSPYGPVGPS